MVEQMAADPRTLLARALVEPQGAISLSPEEASIAALEAATLREELVRRASTTHARTHWWGAEARPSSGNPAMPSRLLTAEEVSELLRVSTKTVRRLVAYRRLPCVRFGRALRFDPGDVLAWLSARKEG
jgi:excisionase family DNA binding protein